MMTSDPTDPNDPLIPNPQTAENESFRDHVVISRRTMRTVALFCGLMFIALLLSTYLLAHNHNKINEIVRHDPSITQTPSVSVTLTP